MNIFHNVYSWVPHFLVAILNGIICCCFSRQYWYLKMYITPLGEKLYFSTSLRSIKLGHMMYVWWYICYFWAKILRASAWLDLFFFFLSNGSVSDRWCFIILGSSINTMRTVLELPCTNRQYEKNHTWSSKLLRFQSL